MNNPYPELLQMALAIQSSGGKIDCCLRSQIALAGVLWCLECGHWERAREHCLTLAELLPDFPPSLRVALR